MTCSNLKIRSSVFLVISFVFAFYFEGPLKFTAEVFAADSGGGALGSGGYGYGMGMGMGMGSDSNGQKFDPDSMLRNMLYMQVEQGTTLLATNARAKAAAELHNLVVPVHPAFDNEYFKNSSTIAAKLIFDKLAMNTVLATQHRIAKNSPKKGAFSEDPYLLGMATMAAQDVIYKNIETWKSTVLWLRTKLSPEQYESIQNEMSFMLPCDSNSVNMFSKICTYNLSEIKLRPPNDPYRKELEVFFMPLNDNKFKTYKPEWISAANNNIEETRKVTENIMKSISAPMAYDPPDVSPNPTDTTSPKKDLCPLAEREGFLKFLDSVKVNSKECVGYSESLSDNCPTMFIKIKKRSDNEWEFCGGNLYIGNAKFAIKQDDFNQALTKKMKAKSPAPVQVQNIKGIR